MKRKGTGKGIMAIGSLRTDGITTYMKQGRVSAVRHRPSSPVVRYTSSTPRRMPWRPQPTAMAA